MVEKACFIYQFNNRHIYTSYFKLQGIHGICQKNSEILGNVLNFGKLFRNFGKIWKTLGNFGNSVWEIPASQEIVTELRSIISATEQGTSRADVH